MNRGPTKAEEGQGKGVEIIFLSFGPLRKLRNGKKNKGPSNVGVGRTTAKWKTA